MTGRVLAITGDGFHGPGGIAQFNRDVIGAWCDMGSVDEIVLVPRHRADGGPLPPNVDERAGASAPAAFVARSVRAALGGGAFRWIFCGHLNMMPLAALLSRLTGAPIWLQLHGIEAWRAPPDRVRRAAESADLVVSVSRHTRREFLRWAHVAPHRARVLPNTVGGEFAPGPPDPEVVRRYGLAGRRIILSVGRLSRLERYKGHDSIIRVLPGIRRKHPDVLLAVAGGGDLIPDLESLARSLGVMDAVRFLGPVPRGDLPSLYRLADVFAMPSTGEGFGIVFLEAMACGTPVIAGAGDGARDPLQDGALGRLAEEGALAPAIHAILAADRQAPGWRQGQAERAESVLRHFGPGTFAAHAAALADAVASRGHRVPA